MKVYARTRNLVEKRVRNWISYMALGGRLEAAAQRTGAERHFTFTGGVVMEMRHHAGARATTDLDLTYIGPEQDPVRAIEDAIGEPYGRFSFRRTGKPLEMSNVNTVRVEIAVRFDGAAWGTVVVDVSRGEDHVMEVELVPTFDIERDFGIQGPERLPCLSARYHLAHKLHGMTEEPADGTPNERVQDAVDVLLFMQIVTDLAAVRQACVDVFVHRKQHTWPPAFSPPESWAPRFMTMATELELEVQDLATTTTVLQKFIHDIDKA